MYSPFYDLEYMYFITINGQLLLTMLSEQMQLEGYRPLMINTDGFEFIIPKTAEDRYHELCTEWEKTTQLQLEHDTYNLMAISNVNNYLAQTTSGKIKQKGLYEITKAYHKDTSLTIVPIALEQYIVNGIPVEETIKNHKNIFDFCAKIRSHSGYDIEYRTLDKDKINIEKLQKINRVFISKSGGVLYKTNGERTEGVYVKRKTTLFNRYFQQEEYDIDYDFYIKECYKIIDEIEPKQLTLF